MNRSLSVESFPSRRKRALVKGNVPIWLSHYRLTKPAPVHGTHGWHGFFPEETEKTVRSVKLVLTVRLSLTVSKYPCTKNARYGF
jgi:hypothetical protein